VKIQGENLSQAQPLGPAIKAQQPEPKAEPVKGKPWLFKAPDGKLETRLPDPPAWILQDPIGYVYEAGFGAYIDRTNAMYKRLAGLE